MDSLLTDSKVYKQVLISMDKLMVYFVPISIRGGK